jgi:hypothetical protein
MAADGWSYGLSRTACPIGHSAQPGEPRLLLRPGSSTESAAPRPAEAAGKSEQDEHTTATNRGETPKNLNNPHITLSLSRSAVQPERFSVMRISRDLAADPVRAGDMAQNDRCLAIAPRRSGTRWPSRSGRRRLSDPRSVWAPAPTPGTGSAPRPVIQRGGPCRRQARRSGLASSDETARRARQHPRRRKARGDLRPGQAPLCTGPAGWIMSG